jgi:hypothetical protein
MKIHLNTANFLKRVLYGVCYLALPRGNCLITAHPVHLIEPVFCGSACAHLGICRCSKGISSVFDPKHIDHIGARPAWPVRLLTKRRWEEFLQRALQARVRKLELQPANSGDVEIPSWPVRNYLLISRRLDGFVTKPYRPRDGIS